MVRKQSETEQYMDRQAELSEEEQARGAAFQQAGNPAAFRQHRDARFIEVLGDPDISDEDDPDDDLASKVTTELSRVHMLSNITEAEYEERRVLAPNKADRLKAEHPPDRGPGSKCVGEVRQIMMAGGSDDPTLTPEMARRYDESMEVRSSMEALAKGGKAFEGITQIQTVAQTDTGSGSTGRVRSTFSRARQLLPGGGS